MEEGEENVGDEEPTEKKVQIEPFSGKPTNILLLSSFKTHVMADIWLDDIGL